jgi:DNA-directed RNA polymerase specialized sigma24 family protein
VNGSFLTCRLRQNFFRKIMNDVSPHFSTVSQWIAQLKTGDAHAAQRLWETYFQRMVQLARQSLEGAPRRAADEEDVALSAFKSFCLGAQAGRFSKLMDADSLWPLLMAITANKSVDLIRENNRQKRGGTGKGGGVGEKSPVHESSLSDLISREPTPEFAAQISDNLQHLLKVLDATGDQDLRRIAILKMDGYSNQDIAESVGCVRRSVERKLQLIAGLWEKDGVA